MRPVRSLTLYLTMIFMGGALLAPWLYWLAHRAAEHFPALREIAAHPFHRFVNRSFLLLALGGLWPFLRSLGVTQWKDVGLENARQHWPKLMSGFGWGFVSLALIAGVVVLSGGRTLDLDHTVAEFSLDVVTTLVAALLIAGLEELLFRGALFGSLRRSHHWMIALLISSTVYALVHFFNRPEPPGEVNWMSGVALLPRMMRGFGDMETLVPGFFTLTLAGIILGYGFQRAGHLFFPIGLHAGWIFWLKTYRSMTSGTPGANEWLWGTGRLIDGWAALLVLGGLLAVFWWRFEPKRGE